MTSDVHTLTSIGVIMDGNRRWAAAHHKPSVEGHRAGYKKFTELLQWANEAGVKNVVVYALSTENLNRSKEEVAYLLDLFRDVVREQIKKIGEEEVRVLCVGVKEKLPDDLVALMDELEEKTATYTERTLVIAAPYGGHAELVDAVNTAVSLGEKVNEDRFADLLWTGAVPNLDLLIRTGGEKRISNFLPWQSAYAELFFVDTLWPDFSEEDFRAIVSEYGTRQRRFGK